jgi:ABC-2 type transport system permease protein
MRREGPLGTSTMIATVTNPALSTPGTIIASLVLTPLLEVVLLVAVTASVGSDDLRDTAYAGLVLAFGLTVLTGTVEQVTRDRRLGVLQDIVGFGLFRPVYWFGKMLVPVVLGVLPAALGSLAVFGLDPRHDPAALGRTLVLICLAALAGGLLGSAASVASLALSDPYLVSNVAQSALLITAGVVLPVALYPGWLAALSRALPFTALVEAVRSPGLGGQLAQETTVTLVWCVIGLVAGRLATRAVRSGRRSFDVW